MVELHTGCYANGYYERASKIAELDKLVKGAELSHSLGMKVNAGHGLNYHNVTDLVVEMPHIYELNIGHSIISRAIFSGIDVAVRDMKAKMHLAYR